MRKHVNSTIRKSFHWTPQGRTNRGSSKSTKKGEIETERNSMGRSYSELQEAAEDRKACSELVEVSPLLGDKW